MTITIRQKALANDNISLYLDIYDGGKRKFEFLSLYLLPEVDAETKARNEETLQRAHQIRAERILHPETIPEVGHLMIVKEIPNDESPEVLDWIQTYIDWMSDNTDYSKAIVDQSKYLKHLMSEFLANKRRPHITLRKFDKEWLKAFFLWLKNDYVPQKYVRVEAKPLCEGSLHNVQQRIVAVFNKAVLPIGTALRVLVFFWTITSVFVTLFLLMSLHRRALMSLIRSPVRQAKPKAFCVSATPGLLSSEAMNLFSSSGVRYCLCDAFGLGKMSDFSNW